MATEIVNGLLKAFTPFIGNAIIAIVITSAILIGAILVVKYVKRKHQAK